MRTTTDSRAEIGKTIIRTIASMGLAVFGTLGMMTALSDRVPVSALGPTALGIFVGITALLTVGFHLASKYSARTETSAVAKVDATPASSTQATSGPPAPTPPAPQSSKEPARSEKASPTASAS